MKTISFLFIMCLISTLVVGQVDMSKQDLDEIKVKPPKFAGVEIQPAPQIQQTERTVLHQYLAERINYEGDSYGYIPEGTEVVQFVVTKNGTLKDFNVINSVSKDIDKEMIRVLLTTDGMWVPGSNNDHPAEMKAEVSVMFGDEENGNIVEHFYETATNCFRVGSKQLLEKGKAKRALKTFDKAARYLPSDTGVLYMRGICHAELGNIEKAEENWNRMVNLGGVDTNAITYNVEGLKGYDVYQKFLARLDK